MKDLVKMNNKEIKKEYKKVWKVYKELHKIKMKDKDYTLSVKDWLYRIYQSINTYNINWTIYHHNIPLELAKKISKIDKDFIKFI